jgi:NAD(P)-dependent dehydrogenase (short-subunit alcohol dehydrogenase family)
MKKLNNKVALITGAATGMGKATAKLFAQEGAKVVIADINDKEAEETAKEIKIAGGHCTFIHADLSKMASVEAMVKKTADTYGKLDIFYHNAGIAGPGYLDRTTEEGYDLVMAVNLKAGFFGAKYAAEEMRKSGGGSMLFTSSTAGLRPSFGSPSYSISKACVIMMTRNLAIYLAKDNIRVNCICPGAIETPQFPVFLTRNPEDNFEKNYAMLKARRPIKRMGKPEDIAEAALFLVSEEASFITGITMPVDGGSMAG